MIFLLCKWYFDISWHKFEKGGRRFSNLPIAIHLNPLQFCPSMPLLGFPVFCLSSSIVLNRYFHILVNSMTIWSVLKLPKIAWPSPFNGWNLFYFCLSFSRLKWQMKLNLTRSEFITLAAFLGGLDFYHVDFSRRAGDFRFKLVASFKILVAMATKMVATWRVVRTEITW